MATNESSGRWDATGSFQDAVNKERELARNWASSLNLSHLHCCIALMATDNNAFTLYERKALLDVVTLRLGKQLEESRNHGVRF